jgi:Tetracyclin repressor-like, C-terminal domain
VCGGWLWSTSDEGPAPSRAKSPVPHPARSSAGAPTCAHRRLDGCGLEDHSRTHAHQDECDQRPWRTVCGHSSACNHWGSVDPARRHDRLSSLERGPSNWRNRVRATFEAGPQEPLDDVAAALSHLIGLTLLDTLIGVNQLNDLSDDDLVALVAPAIRQYLTDTPLTR